MKQDTSNLATRTAVLRCPKCDGTYLHHHTVTVYIRAGEDSRQAIVTTVDDDGARVSKIDGENNGNPSPRRDGLIIRFYCEGCDASVCLDLYQHKGQTFLATRED